MAQCKAAKSDGKPCRGSAPAGEDFCFAHDPNRRARHLDAVRLGGSSRAAQLSREDERAVARRLADPVLWGEHYLRNRDGSPRRYWPHQADDLRCEERNVIHLDGRDCGKCLPGTTRILDVETGERVRLDELGFGRQIAVLADDLKLTTTCGYSVFRNGVQDCFRLRTRTGRSIEATANHPFLTERGWVPLAGLRRDDWLAVPRRLPVELADWAGIGDEELMLLAYLIADGGMAHGSVLFTKSDPVVLDEFRLLAALRFPAIKLVPSDSISYRLAIDRTLVKRRTNPCREWLEGLGLLGCRSAEKFIPGEVFRCSRRQAGLFLSRLFSCDGWVCFNPSQKPAANIEIGYCSASEELVSGVGHLLLRVGIMADRRIRRVNGSDYWCLSINRLDDIRRFARHVGFCGPKQSVLDDLLSHADARSDWQENPHDRVPAPLAAAEVAALRSAGWTTGEITGSASRRLRLHRYNPTRRLLDEYAENTASERLHDLAVSDVYWDLVSEIECVGPRETFDLSVPQFRNFVAEDVIVHNSVCLATDLLHYAFTTRGGQGLVAAPHQGHLDTVIEEVEFQLQASEDLGASVAANSQGRPKITRKPYFRIEFTNGSAIYFRPAGAYGDAFRSLHVGRVWVDEGAWLSERAWRALRQCLKAGGVLRIYSTPNGLRNTTYYRLTQSPAWKVFRWPSWLNPSWDAGREAELEEFYGGKGTPGWQHEVAGEHGRPSYGAFNLEYLNLCRVDVEEYRKVTIMGDDLRGCESEEEASDRIETMLNLAPEDGTYWIGGDLGYTNDPTELVVFRETRSEERTRARLVLRVRMERVAYPHISAAIAILDRCYGPMGIGVDKGGNGLAVVQELTTLDRYRGRDMEKRLRGYDFGGSVTVAVQDGRPLKKRAKEHMTSLVNRALQRRELQLPAGDVEIEDEFTTHTYTLSNGNVVYSKGNDHIVDAVRCAMLVRDQERLDRLDEVVPCLMPLMTDPVFV